MTSILCRDAAPALRDLTASIDAQADENSAPVSGSAGAAGSGSGSVPSSPEVPG